MSDYLFYPLLRQPAKPQNDRRLNGYVDNSRLNADRRRAGIEDQLNLPTEIIVDMLSSCWTWSAGKICARSDDPFAESSNQRASATG